MLELKTVFYILGVHINYYFNKMGTGQSENNFLQSISENWMQNHDQLHQNKHNGIIAKLYHIVINGNIRNEIQIYKFRKVNKFNLVQAYDLQIIQSQQKQLKEMCCEEYKIQVMIEPIILSYQQLNTLSFNEILYALRSSLKAFRFIYDRKGPINITSRMIGINCKGQIKCWLNENWSDNNPREYKTLWFQHQQRKIFEKQILSRIQIQVVQNILQVIQVKCQNSKYPLSFSNYIYLNAQSFHKCSQALENYILTHQIILPDKIAQKIKSQKIINSKNNKIKSSKLNTLTSLKPVKSTLTPKKQIILPYRMIQKQQNKIKQKSPLLLKQTMSPHKTFIQVIVPQNSLSTFNNFKSINHAYKKRNQQIITPIYCNRRTSILPFDKKDIKNTIKELRQRSNSYKRLNIESYHCQKNNFKMHQYRRSQVIYKEDSSINHANSYDRSAVTTNYSINYSKNISPSVIYRNKQSPTHVVYKKISSPIKTSPRFSSINFSPYKFSPFKNSPSMMPFRMQIDNSSRSNTSQIFLQMKRDQNIKINPINENNLTRVQTKNDNIMIAQNILAIPQKKINVVQNKIKPQITEGNISFENKISAAKLFKQSLIYKKIDDFMPSKSQQSILNQQFPSENQSLITF